MANIALNGIPSITFAAVRNAERHLLLMRYVHISCILQRSPSKLYVGLRQRKTLKLPFRQLLSWCHCLGLTVLVTP